MSDLPGDKTWTTHCQQESANLDEEVKLLVSAWWNNLYSSSIKFAVDSCVREVQFTLTSKGKEGRPLARRVSFAHLPFPLLVSGLFWRELPVGRRRIDWKELYRFFSQRVVVLSRRDRCQSPVEFPVIYWIRYNFPILCYVLGETVPLL